MLEIFGVSGIEWIIHFALKLNLIIMLLLKYNIQQNITYNGISITYIFPISQKNQNIEDQE